MTTRAAPARAARHACSRSPSPKAECSTAIGTLKSRAETLEQLRRQSDFGHQHQRAFAAFERARARGADTPRSCRFPLRPAAGTRRSGRQPASTAVTASVCAVLNRGGGSPLPTTRDASMGAPGAPSMEAGRSNISVQPRFVNARALARHWASSSSSAAAAMPSGCAISRSASSLCRGARFGSPALTAARPASVSRNHVSVATAAWPSRSAAGNAAAYTSPGGCW